VYISFLSVEIEAYKTLDPDIRLIILKAICDIRVEVCFYIFNNNKIFFLDLGFFRLSCACHVCF
jgi:hypothetical protein